MSVNLSDVRNHTEIGTGYTKDAMLNKCADEIEKQQSRIDDLEKLLAIAVDAMTKYYDEMIRQGFEGGDALKEALTRIKQLQEKQNE